jgi:hypothetical protein
MVELSPLTVISDPIRIIRVCPHQKEDPSFRKGSYVTVMKEKKLGRWNQFNVNGFDQSR